MVLAEKQGDSTRSQCQPALSFYKIEANNLFLFPHGNFAAVCLIVTSVITSSITRIMRAILDMNHFDTAWVLPCENYLRIICACRKRGAQAKKRDGSNRPCDLFEVFLQIDNRQCDGNDQAEFSDLVHSAVPLLEAAAILTGQPDKTEQLVDAAGLIAGFVG